MLCSDLPASPFFPWKHPWAIRLKPFELPAVANIGLQLVHACEYMHSKQIIHTGMYMYVCKCVLMRVKGVWGGRERVQTFRRAFASPWTKVLSRSKCASSPHIQLLKQISEEPSNPKTLIADIKCENILLAAGPEGSFTIKLVDMGSSLFKSWWHPPIIGTMEYRAPETLLQVCVAQRRTSECPSDLPHAECVHVYMHTRTILCRCNCE